ncbi:chemosensory pili system protein ChpA (sensor histidine kinase/response regulator) [Natronospira proteinivora]|uniref:histidine kinase n=1 Tax=Natronospira proteinivora TaxID=1807133 RepID=A0ABT1GAQ5_9GAMM|nr:Hpt domain-containing protein [Natronospira proteinivora]MCP1728411.1 chemosensory pili system protein ChpA (sensor histidine kinase/response regulator) [Natronospira proteinivora]
MTQAASDSLLWIKGELDTIFTEARQGLESYVEDERPEGLEKCLKALRQAHGTLRMVEVYGAAMLAEEMAALGRAVSSGELKEEEAGLEVLTRGLLQLPDYLERIAAGQPDMPMALLSLINDMRAARGRPLLSESAIFARDIGGRGLTEKVARPGTAVGDSQQLAQKLRSKFQKALLGWYREPTAGKYLKALAKISEKLEEASESPPVFQLWWVVGGALEALAHGGLEADVSFKQLMGRVDREIKRLATDGEGAIQADPPEELINNLLYYIARATAGGDRVSGIRESFGLDEFLPDEEKVKSVEAALSGPNAALMQTVSAAVKEDLARVKDTLDIYVRTGQADTEELQPLSELLRKVSDTLGMLGLDKLKEQVAGEQESLAQMSGGQASVDDDSLMRTASTLLEVEQRLDRQMVGVPAVDQDDSEDFEQASGAVIRECIVNLARVKEKVQDYVKAPERRGELENVPELVQQIRAGLSLLDLDRVGEILQAAAFFIRDRIFGAEQAPTQQSLDLLADAIVSTEFYLETIQQGRGRPESMLDNAEQCISELGYRPGALPTEPPESATEVTQADEPEAPSAMPSESDELSIDLPESEEEASEAASETPNLSIEDETVATEPEQADPEPAAADVPRPPKPEKKRIPQPDEVAPEIVEIFLEEAEEELASLREYFPRWQNNPDDENALTTIRRSFHTLKGSGRMVGAEFIGEFAWSFENLLNRIIDKTIEPKPAMVSMVSDAIEAIPELVAQLKGEGEPEVDAIGLMEAADAYSRGEEPAGPPADAQQPDLHSGHLATETDSDLAAADVDLEANLSTSAEDEPDADLKLEDEGQRDDALDAALDALSSEFSGEASAEEVDSRDAADKDDVLDLGDENDALSLDGLEVGEDEPEPAMDPVLYDIFRKETERHLGTVESELQEIEDASEVSAELLRALHTLKGSAHTADVDEIPEIAGPLEHAGLAMNENGVAPGPEMAEVLRDAVAAIRGMLDGLATPEGAPAPDPALLDRIRALPTEAPVAQTPPPVETLTPDGAEPSVQEEAAGPPGPTPADIPLDDLLDYDQELAGVFMEEANELQEAMDEALQEWHQSHDDAALVAALQRHLHTLKGGARMSGITPMGDLSHEMETILTKAVDGKLPISGEMTNLIQRCVDRVHRMIEQVEGGDAIITGDDLIDELQRLDARGGQVFEDEDDATLEMPESSEETEAPAAEHQPAETPPQASGSGEESLEPSPAETGPDEAAVDQAAAPTEPAAATGRVETADKGHDPVAEHGERRASPRVQQEVVRVRADLLENLLNNAGEVSIYRARVEQQLSNMDFHLKELDQTVDRLRQQFRNLEIEIEAQVRYQWEKEEGGENPEFDPLELDRYSQLQQFSRALQESVSDLVSLQGLLSNHAREAETLLVQQSRVNTDLQDGLMRTRMLPFSRHAQRLRRLVRQTAQEEGKEVELRLIGGEGEMDRQVLERIIAPLEHMLRNAVIHGLETPQDRDKEGKPEEGLIAIELHREGSEVVIEVMDDGRGLNVDKIRKRAEKMGMIRDGAQLPESDIIQYILEPGFSTAETVTQSAGRGVGMDVVHSEIKQLGGSLHMTSSEGVGSRFTIRLPYTLAITQALMVNVADEVFAIPLPSIEGIVRIPQKEVQEKLAEESPRFRYGGRDYELQHLSGLLGFGRPDLPDDAASLPVLLVRVGDHASALVTEGMRGSREVVVKSVGPQIANVRGISGATIMGDGSIVLILDVGGMVRGGMRSVTTDMADSNKDIRTEPHKAQVPMVMVVDDSITVRRVTERLLLRQGYEVMTAKDGVDALAELQDRRPDVMLLDIEMPRMDGYELATHMRNDEQLKEVPIIMITSRTGEKHRNRAFEIGVDRYLGKPYQETELMENIRALVGDFDPQNTRWGSE